MNEQVEPFNPEAWLATTRFHQPRPLLPELAYTIFGELSSDQQHLVYISLSKAGADQQLLTDTWDYFTDQLELAD